MLSVRKTDPRFVNYVPTTAVEAVERYVRCRRNGLKAYLVPECLIDCARGLSPVEMSKFEAWIVNPDADLSKVKLVEQKAIREANDSVFAENAKRVEALLDDTPPLPMEIDDEKMPAIDLLTIREELPRMGTPSTR
jgi:hypothetical protein